MVGLHCRLKAWIEEDEDLALKKAKEEANEQQVTAKKSHEQFVKHKDRCALGRGCTTLGVAAV